MPQDDNFRSRSLNSDEMILVKRLFGSAVDPCSVTIFETALHEKTGKRMYVIGGDMYCPIGTYLTDFACQSEMSLRYTFVHEMAHIWQHQQDIRSKKSLRWQWQVGAEKLKVAMVPRHAAQDAYDDYLELAEAEHRVKQFTKLQKAAINAKLSGLDAKIDSIDAGLAPLEATVRSLDHKINYTGLTVNGVAVSKMPIDKADPLLPSGRRLSEVAWQNPKTRRLFKTRQAMVEAWRDYETDDYDYMNASLPLTRDGTDSFYDLNFEQQAEMIAEYYLLTLGVDPATTKSGLRLSGKPRPPMRFYETYIPFVFARIIEQR